MLTYAFFRDRTTRNGDDARATTAIPIQLPIRQTVTACQAKSQTKTFARAPNFARAIPPPRMPPPATPAAEPLAPLLRRLGLGRLARALLEEVVVLRHHLLTFFSSSSSSRSRFDSFFGTAIRTRAITSPRPEPFSFGAPWPRTRSSLPSSEPAGIFSETGPVGGRHLDGRAERGVGERDGHLDDQIVAAPLEDLRRLDVRDDVEVAGGRRRPSPASPLPFSRMRVPSLTPAGIFTV